LSSSSLEEEDSFYLLKGLDLLLGPLAKLLFAFSIDLLSILSHHFFEHCLDLLVAMYVLDVLGILGLQEIRVTLHHTALFRRVSALAMEHAVLSVGFETRGSFPFLRNRFVMVERNLLFNPI